MLHESLIESWDYGLLCWIYSIAVWVGCSEFVVGNVVGAIKDQLMCRRADVLGHIPGRDVCTLNIDDVDSTESVNDAVDRWERMGYFG